MKHLLEISEVLKIEKQVINIPNFTTPVQSIINPSTEAIHRGTMQKISKDIPFYPDPVYQPSPKPVKYPCQNSQEKMDINPELNTDFEEN